MPRPAPAALASLTAAALLLAGAGAAAAAQSASCAAPPPPAPPQPRFVPVEPAFGTDFASCEEEFAVLEADAPAADRSASDSRLPEWVADPPAGRVVVTGPVEATAAAATAAARESVRLTLANAAGLPRPPRPEVAGRFVRRSHVEAIERRTENHAFTVYRTRLLIDLQAGTAEATRAHRAELADRRAATLAAGLLALTAAFGGVWGVGRRRLGGSARSEVGSRK